MAASQDNVGSLLAQAGWLTARALVLLLLLLAAQAAPTLASTPQNRAQEKSAANAASLLSTTTPQVLESQWRVDSPGDRSAQLDPLLANPIRFTSREFDAETGLYYNRARYLDPTTGRWKTQDPLGFAAGDAKLYRYVGNTSTYLGVIEFVHGEVFVVRAIPGPKLERLSVPVSKIFDLALNEKGRMDHDEWHQWFRETGLPISDRKESSYRNLHETQGGSIAQSAAEARGQIVEGGKHVFWELTWAFAPAAAVKGVHWLDLAKRAPRSGGPRTITHIGDLTVQEKAALDRIWTGGPRSALPLETREALAAHYRRVAASPANPPGYAQSAFQEARARYLLGEGPNPGSTRLSLLSFLRE